MAVSSGFFNSLDGDRKYSAEQMSQLFDGLIRDGVYRSIYDTTNENTLPFKVIPGDGLSVKVRKGRAWYNHSWLYNDGDISLSLGAAPSSGLSRYDAILLQFNADDRVNTIIVSPGTAVSSNPEKPRPANTNSVKYVPIADILVSAGDTSVLQANIDQTVIGTDAAPYVTSPLESISVSQYLAQWSAEYNVWKQEQLDEMEEFTTSLHNVLSEEQAGNLYNMIGRVGSIYIGGQYDGSNSSFVGKYVEFVNSSGTRVYSATTTNSGRVYKRIGELWDEHGDVTESCLDTWTITMYESELDRTRLGPVGTVVAKTYGTYDPVQIGADKLINVNLNGDAFRNQTVTLTNGSESYSAVAPSSGTNRVSFMVQTSGTWTASVTASGRTYSGSVNASTAGTYSITINYTETADILRNGTDRLSAGSKNGDGSAVVTKGNNTITLKSDSVNCEQATGTWTINLDLTKYRHLNCTFSRSGNCEFKIGNGSYRSGTGTQSIDIASLSGTGNTITLHYVNQYVGAGTCSASLSNIWVTTD